MFGLVYKLVRIRTKLDAHRWALAITLAAVVFALLFFEILHDGPYHLPTLSSIVITAILIAAPASYWACIQIFLIYQLGNKLKNQVEIDALTKMKTRRYLFESLFKSLEQKQSDYVLLMVDIDHFKSINDNFNHIIGDQVLQHVSSAMAQACRSTDVVCRFGGEEFAVVLPDCNYETGYMIAERVRSRVASQPFLKDERTISVTVSIGVAMGRCPKNSPDDVLRMADDALYDAKRTGRNRVVAAENEANADGEPKSVVKSQLTPSKETIKQLEFVKPHLRQRPDGSYQAKFQDYVMVTAFQPVMASNSDGELTNVGYEALIRATIDGISITPGELFSRFSGAARYQLECISHVLHVNNFIHIDCPDKKLFLNVNLNVLKEKEQVGHYLEFVAFTLASQGVAANNVALEIVESDLMYPEQLADFMGATKYHKLAVAIDNFGSGDSDLNRCMDMAPSIIKIDHGLFHRSMENKSLFWLLHQILDRFQQKGVQIVIEGVEDDAQLDASISLGAKLMQGFHLAKPLLPPYQLPEDLKGKKEKIGQLRLRRTAA